MAARSWILEPKVVQKIVACHTTCALFQSFKLASFPLHVGSSFVDEICQTLQKRRAVEPVFGPFGGKGFAGMQFQPKELEIWKSYGNGVKKTTEMLRKFNEISCPAIVCKN